MVFDYYFFDFGNGFCGIKFFGVGVCVIYDCMVVVKMEGILKVV